MTILAQLQKKTTVNVKFSNKSSQDFLHCPNEESLFIAARDAHELDLIIFSLNSDRSTDPSNLPTKILRILKKWDFLSRSRYI